MAAVRRELDDAILGMDAGEMTTSISYRGRNQHTGAASEEERFWGKVEVGEEDACWPWLGRIGDGGYGLIRARGKSSFRAHRLSWSLHFGAVPDGLCVLHSCDVPACVNPKHLFLGTKKDNSRDMARKGRAGSQRYSDRYRNPHMRRLTEAQVREIKKRLVAGEPQSVIAADYPVGKTQINNIACGRAWAWTEGKKVEA